MTTHNNTIQQVKEWGFGFVVIFAMLELKYLFKEDYFSKMEIANFLFSKLKKQSLSSYANNVLVTLYRLYKKNLKMDLGLLLLHHKVQKLLHFLF